MIRDALQFSFGAYPVHRLSLAGMAIMHTWAPPMRADQFARTSMTMGVVVMNTNLAPPSCRFVQALTGD